MFLGQSGPADGTRTGSHGPLEKADEVELGPMATKRHRGFAIGHRKTTDEAFVELFVSLFIDLGTL